MIDVCMIFILPILGYCDTPWWPSWFDEPLEIATSWSLRRETIIAEILVSLSGSFLEFYFLRISRHGSWVYFGDLLCCHPEASCSSGSVPILLLYLFDICDLGSHSIRRGEWEWSLIHMDRIIESATSGIDEITIELGNLRFAFDRGVVQEWCEEHLRLTISSTAWEPDCLVVARYPGWVSVIVSHITGYIRIDERAIADDCLSLDHDKNSEHRNENKEDF